MPDFLLEIGCEDLPASFVPSAVDQLGSRAADLLKELRLGHGEVYATGAVRRLVLLVRDLSPVQESAVEVITGPPVAKGFDEDGRPTPAAEGFAHARGVDPGELKAIETERGTYVGFERKLKRSRAGALLKQRIPQLITSLRFPKTMRWEGSGTRFARPIRWIVCLLGDAVVPLRVAGVRADRVTYLCCWMPKKKLKIRRAETYLEQMQRWGVCLDRRQRRRLIESLARRTAARSGLKVVEDEGLFDELTFMLEQPKALMGEFPEQYLDLPPEVVRTAMRAHQRYLAVEDGRGALAPRFVAFFEGGVRGSKLVREGNERVLKARLEDALFYWRGDVRKGIRGLAQKLAGIVFIAGLGTVAQKAERLSRMMEWLDGRGPSRRFPAEALRELPLLAKADLASEMIRDGKEFTSLEGLIGAHYARLAGESDQVVAAIAEHYLPQGSADPLPTTELGLYLSLCDKVDNLCGCFLAGYLPTGSQDPYALRRQAVGVFRLLERLPLAPVDDLFARGFSLYRGQGLSGEGGENRERTAKLEEFFRGRAVFHLRERGFAPDLVEAVVSRQWHRPRNCSLLTSAMAEARRRGSLADLLKAAKRVANILPQREEPPQVEVSVLAEVLEGKSELRGGVVIRPALLKEPAEASLHRALTALLSQVHRREDEEDFPAILATLAGLTPLVDGFFDRVMVMCPDAELRANRIALLSCLHALYSRYAMFSKISEEG